MTTLDAMELLYGSTEDYEASRQRSELDEKYAEGTELARVFIEQMNAYYADPRSSFYDEKIERKFLEQKLAHLGFTPYPKDGLVTFGASGTNKCDREIVFKNAKVKTEKTPDLPHRARQRRVGTAVIDYVQLDIAHVPKRMGNDAVFKFGLTKDGWCAMEGAVQVRQVIEHKGVKFAITVKPDGIFNYRDDADRRFLFEYKTKASGVVEMNGKLDYSGAQDDHLRQVTAEAIVYGINEGFIVYESMAKPAWFSDEDKKNVPKTRKTWREGIPVPDLRAMYFYITEEMKTALLDDLARQAQLVYDGEIPAMTVDMTSKCGFCAFREHCRSSLTGDEIAELISVEQAMANSHMAGKRDHSDLRNYLADVK